MSPLRRREKHCRRRILPPRLLLVPLLALPIPLLPLLVLSIPLLVLSINLLVQVGMASVFRRIRQSRNECRRQLNSLLMMYPRQGWLDPWRVIDLRRGEQMVDRARSRAGLLAAVMRLVRLDSAWRSLGGAGNGAISGRYACSTARQCVVLCWSVCGMIYWSVRWLCVGRSFDRSIDRSIVRPIGRYVCQSFERAILVCLLAGLLADECWWSLSECKSFNSGIRAGLGCVYPRREGGAWLTGFVRHGQRGRNNLR